MRCMAEQQVRRGKRQWVRNDQYTAESCNGTLTCRSSYQEKKHLERVNKARSIPCPNFITLKRRQEVEPYRSGIVEDRKMSEGGSAVYTRMTGMVNRAQGLIDEVTEV